MPVTRINNNQISDSSAGNLYLGIDASTKLQDYSLTSGKIANNLTYGSDLTVAGNLTVQGNTTTIDTVNLVVEDPLILLADAQTGSPTLDIGYIGKRGTEENVALVWDESADAFVTAFTTSEVTNTTINITSYASFYAGNLETNGTLDVTGATTLTGNVTVGNFFVDGQKTIDMGNSIIGNVQNPVANNDVATKQYVDQQSASGFTIEDDTANTTIVSGGDTLQLLGTANEVEVLITNADQVTFGLPTDVVVAGNLDANNVISVNNVEGVTLTATGNINGNNAVITNNVGAASVTASGNVDGANVNATTNVTGTTFTASGNVNANNAVITNNVGAATGSFTGNVDGANLNATTNVTGTTMTATGNVNANNVVSTNDVTTATVTATGNINGGNLISAASVEGVTLTATGNVNGNNAIITNLIQGTTGSFSGNIDGANLNLTLTAFVGNLEATGNVDAGVGVNTNSIYGAPLALYSQGDLSIVASGNILGNGSVINNIADPVQPQDAATKYYVDTVAEGLHIHASCEAATPANLATISGGTITYNNGSSGDGATLTTTGTYSTIDGVNIATVGARILVKDEPTLAYNGIYTYANATALVRATDYNSAAEIQPGDLVFVNSGNIYGNSQWVQVDEVTTIGTDPILWEQFGGAGTYSAGNGIVIVGTVITAKVDEVSTSFDAGGNIVVKQGAVLVDPFIGNATANSLAVAGNGLITATTIELTGNVLAGNVNSNAAVTGVTGIFSGNVDANNAIVTNNIQGGTITSLGNIDGANVNATTNVTGTTFTASGNVNANNVVSTNDVTTVSVTASGNVNGANLNATTNVTGTTLTASGNVNANNAVITNDVSAVTATLSGNINAAGGVYTGNVTAQYFIGDVIGNISGNIDAGGANTQIQFNDDNVLNGSAAFTFDKTSNLVTASGNISAGNLIATTNVEGVTLTASGNVNANNAVVTNGVSGATGTFTTSVQGGNITISGDSIDGSNGIIIINDADADTDFAVNGDTTPNVFYVDAGTGTASFGNSTQTTGAIVAFNSTDTVLLPVGNTAQRPTGVTGMFRYNTTEGAVEWYDGSQWESASSDFTVIVDDSFQGDGSTTTFTLSQDSTTAGTIVTINGVVQIPTTAYSVTGNSLQFTEAPEVSDTIDARILTTTATVTSLSGTGGGLIVGSSTDVAFTVTGNLIPAANVTYDLGNSTNWWNNGWFSGTTIHLGGLQLKAAGNVFSVYAADGTTPASFNSQNVDTSSISNGTSNMSIATSGGNISAAVGGTQILSITAAGIVNDQANGVGNIGSSTSYFNTVFAKATSAQYADLAEMYEADRMIEPGTVVCFGGAKEVTVCGEDGSRRVAGVVSTNPSYIMNAGLQGDNVVAVALTGRVPVKVTGTIRKGDMIVATGDGRGRAEANPAVGQVIGKALADFEGTDGVIEVVVGRL